LNWPMRLKKYNYIPMLELRSRILKAQIRKSTSLSHSKVENARAQNRASLLVSTGKFILKLAEEERLKKCYNEEKETLEHFRSKEKFLRSSKKAFISFVLFGSSF